MGVTLIGAAGVDRANVIDRPTGAVMSADSGTVAGGRVVEAQPPVTVSKADVIPPVAGDPLHESRTLVGVTPESLAASVPTPRRKSYFADQIATLTIEEKDRLARTLFSGSQVPPLLVLEFAQAVSPHSEQFTSIEEIRAFKPQTNIVFASVMNAFTVPNRTLGQHSQMALREGGTKQRLALEAIDHFAKIAHQAHADQKLCLNNLIDTLKRIRDY